MFLFLKGLFLMLSLLMGATGSGTSIHSGGSGVSVPMDGGGGMPGKSDGTGGGGG
jgi:hypothetical protein